MGDIKIIASDDIGHDMVYIAVILNNHGIEHHAVYYRKYKALLDKLFNHYMVDYNVTVEDYCQGAQPAELPGTLDNL